MRHWQTVLLASAILLAVSACGGGGGAVNPPGGFDATLEIQVMLNRHNNTRAALGLGTLAVNPILAQIAQSQANYMASIGQITHTDGTGGDAAERASNAGYAWSWLGENVGFDTDAVDVYQAWLNSQGHYDNITGTHFTEIGIGVALAGATQYWCVDFGTQ